MSFAAGGMLVTDPRGGTTVEAAQRDRICPRSMAAMTNEHKLGTQHDRNLPSRSLEAGNPKSKCRQGWFFPEAPGEGLLHSSSSFWPWTHHSNVWLRHHTAVLPLRVCCHPKASFCVPTSYKDAGHVASGPTLLQSDLVLTNYISKDPMSNKAIF